MGDRPRSPKLRAAEPEWVFGIGSSHFNQSQDLQNQRLDRIDANLVEVNVKLEAIMSSEVFSNDRTAQETRTSA